MSEYIPSPYMYYSHLAIHRYKPEGAYTPMHPTTMYASTSSMSLITPFLTPVLVAYAVVALVVGIIEYIIITGGIRSRYYRMLRKPSIMPHERIFLLLWLITKSIIVGSTFSGYISGTSSQQILLNLSFALQMLLSLVWFILFFRNGDLQGALLTAALLFTVSIWELMILQSINTSTAMLYFFVVIWNALVVYITWQVLVNNTV